MRLVSWNVNGLRAIMKKDFVTQFKALDADVLCLQEVKARQDQVDLAPLAPPHRVAWNPAEKPGYSGVATFSLKPATSLALGIGSPEHDREGRVLTLEFPDFFLVNVYTPNAQDELRRLAYRQRWDADFASYLASLDQQKPVLACGDFNVAHQEIDLARPAANRKNAGFSDEEREGFSNLLAAGFVDSFRHLHPDRRDAYSWWSYRGGARDRNVGWRLDYWLCSSRLAPSITAAEILPEFTGSDHCPVILEIGL